MVIKMQLIGKNDKSYWHVVWFIPAIPIPGWFTRIACMELSIMCRWMGLMFSVQVIAFHQILLAHERLITQEGHYHSLDVEDRHFVSHAT